MDPVRASYDTVARRYADEIAGELVNKPVDRALYTLFADRQPWPDVEYPSRRCYLLARLRTVVQ